MPDSLILIAAVTGGGASALALWVLCDYLNSHSLQAGASQRLVSVLSWSVLGWWVKPALSLSSRLLIPLITWSNRRRLSEHLRRANVLQIDFAELFTLQFLGTVCWLVIVIMASMLWLTDWLRPDGEALYWILFVAVTSLIVWCLPIYWLKKRYQSRIQAIERALPFFLEMTGLGLAAGQSLPASIRLASVHLRSGDLKLEWERYLIDIRSGMTRVEALRQLGARIDSVNFRQVLSALIQGEVLGLSMVRIIQVYAEQQRAERLLAIEKMALQAPVKMLFPLGFFIMPCTFLVLAFPVVVQLTGISH